MENILGNIHFLLPTVFVAKNKNIKKLKSGDKKPRERVRGRK